MKTNKVKWLIATMLVFSSLYLAACGEDPPDSEGSSKSKWGEVKWGEDQWKQKN